MDDVAENGSDIATRMVSGINLAIDNFIIQCVAPRGELRVAGPAEP